MRDTGFTVPEDRRVADAGEASVVSRVDTDTSIASGFLRSHSRDPSSLALEVDGIEYSYRALNEHARAWANALRDVLPSQGSRIGLFAVRSLEAYAGMLAALYARAAFVPFHHSHPAQRLSVMAAVADLDAIIADEASLPALTACLALMERAPAVLVPRLLAERPAGFSGTWRNAIDVARVSDAQTAFALDAGAQKPDSLAYLLFTSGTTGVPKAVCVSHANVRAFVTNACARFPFAASDRFSQTYDQTFDPSIFDLFVAWESGASVHVPKAMELMAPGRFIDRQQLTVWSSVPSIIGMMRRKNFLPADRFPSLRYSMFCDEGLSLEYAQAWRQAAPNSVIENLYGPTEATVVCTGFRVEHDMSSELVVDGKVPIGTPFPGHQALIVDDALQPLPDGESGELCIAGPQVAQGYWKAPEQTLRAFVSLTSNSDFTSTRFYRTGDLARRFPSGDIACLGRIDHQVKILGRRVELGEIETRVAKIAGVTEVVALGWPLDGDGGPSAVTIAVSGVAPSLEVVRASLSGELPDYMIPSRVLLIDPLPLNVNGKVDRKAILQQLKDGA